MPTALGTVAGSFAMTRTFIEANLNGMDADAAGLSAGDGGSSAHWVLGHVVYWRNRAVGMLGGEPLWAEGQNEEFRGVDKGDLTGSPGRPFTTLRDDLAAVSERLDAALEGAEPSDEVLQGLSFLATHEAYHSGQFGIFRRLAGLTGAIGK